MSIKKIFIFLSASVLSFLLASLSEYDLSISQFRVYCSFRYDKSTFSHYLFFYSIVFLSLISFDFLVICFVLIQFSYSVYFLCYLDFKLSFL